MKPPSLQWFYKKLVETQAGLLDGTRVPRTRNNLIFHIVLLLPPLLQSQLNQFCFPGLLVGWFVNRITQNLQNGFPQNLGG